ncbi:MAG: PAS domain-containing protein, partial [Planctomycetales bacterium]|nr:PAS domain-containing protein [Planctomycetales bacterium]
SPDFKSLMDELLARRTKIPIHRVEDGMRVEANAIYLIPPKRNMVLENSHLRLTEQPAGGLNLPIDLFFQSLAKDAGNRAIAIVLSGTGSDGSRGIRDIHKAGGLVMVQSIQSAGFDGMPRSALRTGLAHVVSPPANMPSRLTDYVASPETFSAELEKENEGEGELAVVFRLFRNQYGIDFSFYKPSTITRRLERRVKLTGCETLTEYLHCIESDSRELDTLYRDLLVEVTHFFRDPESFQRLRDTVIPQLVEQAVVSGEMRVWVPGCATGEEAYSIAILVHDCIHRQGHDIDLKVFATDVHQTSMETASAGVYSSASVSRMPIEFRERYFARIGDLYHVDAALRQCVIFAPHDLTKDPPFTRIDLVSCRNVLIYLDAEVQRRIVSLFHFGLVVGGVLFLGPSETLGELEKEFEPIDRHWRLFRKLRNVRLPSTGPISPQSPLNRMVVSRPSYLATQTRTDKSWLVPEVYDHLLARYVPPSLLINQHLELVHSFGDARRLLVQPEGKATLDVTRMVEGELRTAVSAALHRASTTDSTIVYEGVKVRTPDGELPFRLVAEPYVKSSERMFLVSLEEMQPVEAALVVQAETFDSVDQSAQRIVSLERELDYTKETLQATVEELETSNEELQSTNEELVASNEELQSTNEELHSVNEELYTVNAEHQKKIAELTQMTDDMDHLLKSTEIGTLFLDSDLRIRKFTPAITSVFHVLDQDIGRPVSHIAHTLPNWDLVGDSIRVMQSGRSVERSVGTADRQFLIRLLPYQIGDEVGGVIVTLIDISKIMSVQKQLMTNPE